MDNQQNIIPTTQPTQAIDKDFSVKLWNLKYLLIITALIVIFILIGIFKFNIGYLSLVLGVVLSFVWVADLKKDITKSNDDSKKTKAVIAMGISPLFGQAVYYFSLHKKYPKIAKGFNNLGWKILGLEFLMGILITVVIIVFSGVILFVFK